ncbi:hypothetical protein Golomagni_00936 [Golovinomyces magnicellulatus]|nr:hypothetical protein Golomagni_00936 [Golovinomyces magnicellulatus]
MELAIAGRKRKRKREHPGHQSELIAWFKSRYDHTLNQSQVSKILSSSYDHLDSLDTKKDKCLLEVKRQSAGDWPDLEGALFDWQQRMQKNKAVITGDILKNQASKLWDGLPQFEDRPKPKFSNGG